MRPAHFNVLRKRAPPISLGNDAGDAAATSSAAATSTAADDNDDPTSTTSRSTATVISTTTTSTPDADVTTTSSSSTARTSATDPDPLLTSTTLSSSSSSLSSSSSSSTTRLSTTSLATSAIVEGSSTSYITNIVTVGAPSASVSSSAAPSSGGGNGPGAGVVVGIVAGSLVGIVVIAGLLGYFFKSKFGKDKDDDIDDAVFNKNDFRHESILLQDDEIDRMSLRSGSAAGSLNAAGMGRNLPGLARNNTAAPRPPSTFERHVYNASPISPHFAGAPPMPSFQPGQIVNTNFYHAPSNNYAQSDGGWGVAASYAQPTSNNHLQPGYGSLDRNPSMSSHYEETGLNRQASAYSSPYREHDYPPQNGRSGSPVDHNPQQFYDNHGGSTQRQLSVRNQRDSAVYEGMGF